MASVTAYVNSTAVFGSNINKIYLASDGSLNTTLSDVISSIESAEKHPSSGYNYIGIMNDGIYRHDQNSSTAQRVSHWIINVPSSAGISFIQTANITPDSQLYMYHELSGYVFKSNNLGKTSQIVNTGLPSTLTGSSSANAFEFIDNYAFMGMANGQGCYRLSLSSDTWSSVTGLASKTIIALASDRSNNYIYALTNDGLWLSTDNGVVWSNKRNSITAGRDVFVNQSTGTVYVSASEDTPADHIIRSTNHGDSWSSVLTGVISSIDVNYAESLLFAYDTSLSAVKMSSDNGDNWTTGTATPEFFSKIVSDQNNPHTLYGISTNGLYYSTTSISAWTQSLTASGANLEEFNNMLIDINGNLLLFGHQLSSSKSTPKIQRYVNSWKLDTVSFRNISNIKFDTSLNMIYAIPGSGVFKKDSGSEDDFDYAHINNGLKSTRIREIETNSSYTFLATKSGVYRSDPSTYTSWTAANTGLTTLDALSIVKSTSDETMLFVGTKDGGVFKSTDNGSNWINVGFQGKSVVSLMVTNNGYIYAAVDQFGVYVSIDNGSNWTILSGLGETEVKKLGKKNDAEFYISVYK